MSERLRLAYQRFEARRAAINALTGKRIYYPLRWMQGYDRPYKAPVQHLRMVGKVQTENRRYGDTFTYETAGWYTDDDGLVMKDGTGLVWGEVYQLPARDGKMPFHSRLPVRRLRWWSVDGLHEDLRGQG